MTGAVLSLRAVAVRYRGREVFHGVSGELPAGHALGVVGASGSGKTSLLRTIAGLMRPAAGEIRVHGRLPQSSRARAGLAYFAGEASLPGSVRASAWGRLSGGDAATAERRRLRTLSRGARQLLGLRTVLGRVPIDLIVLDEPWEGLDPDGARWLSATLEAKRDKGAAVVVSSHRLHDLAGLCDAYLLLHRGRAMLLPAAAVCDDGAITAAQLADTLERLRLGMSGPSRRS